MKKRLLSVFMCFCMMLTMVPAAFAVEAEQESPAAVEETSDVQQPDEQAAVPEETNEVEATPDDESGAAHYELTATKNIEGTVVAGRKYENGVSATLKNTTAVAGITDALLKFKLTEQPENSNPQILAKDTEDKEWNLAETGQWGPAQGFPITANYDVTTQFSVLFDKAGTYTAEFKLVSVENQDEALATGTMTIEVAVSEDSAIQVEYTKDGQSKTVYYTGENNDDRNQDHFWDVISDLSSGYLAADTSKPITVTLLKDIALKDTTILVDAGKKVTINGNGHTITATMSGIAEAGKPGADAVSITADSALTLNNVKLDIKAADAAALAGNTSTQGIYNGGSLTLTGNAEVTVSGVSKNGINANGEIKLETGSVLSVSNVGGTAVKGASLTADGATITVENAAYYGISADTQKFTGSAVTVTSSGTAGDGYPAVWAKNFTLSGGTMNLTENGSVPAEEEPVLLAAVEPLDFNIVSINSGSATVEDGAVLTGGIETKASQNSNVTVTGAEVTGSVTNNGTGKVEISDKATVSSVTNTSSGSVVINKATVEGAVTNSSSDGKVSVISSAVGGVSDSGSNTVIVDSTVGGKDAEDQVPENAVALYNGTTYTSLKAAVDAATGEGAKAGDIMLVADATLTEKITIAKDVTIVGNGKTITGKADSTEVYFEVTGGTLNISGAKLANFGNTAGSLTGHGVFKIPSTANKAKIVASGLTVETFNRAAFDVRNGEFEIKDCVINCDNGQEATLTKGIVAGYDATGTVTGSVDGCTITGSNSTYEGWSSNGIEISAGAKVTISNTTINSMKGGISVARNYGHGVAEVTLENCTVTGEDYALRIFESNSTSEPVEGSSAKLTVQGGIYTGDVRISRKDTDQNGENNSDSSTITVAGGSFDSSVAQYADSSLKYEAVASDGKKFTYHKTAGEAIAAAGNGGTITMIAGESAEKADTVTLDYGYSDIKYTVKVPAGEKLELPTAAREGYTFQGWYLNNSKITEYTAAREGGQTVIIAAQWSKNGGSSGGSSGGGGGSSSASYAITVDKTTGGTIKVSPTRADKGDTVTITVNPNNGYELDKLVVTDKNGDTVKLTDKGDGKFTFKMPSSKVTVEASFAKTGEKPVPTPAPSFTDVPAGAYYAAAVEWAVDKGITSGTSATTFSPDMNCTRAQMVTFLWRAAGSPKATGNNPFTDVNSSAYYYDAVLWAVEQGITSGTSATTFAPDATVTRGQTVTFLYRANQSPAVSGSGFADVSADAYYANAVAWAVSEGITNGTSATTFSPDNACTRAQIVTFMYRDAQ